MAKSLAERTRAAAYDYPFLLATLRAGICNYAAAARFLDVDGEEAAVATALRRFEGELPTLEFVDVEARVVMESGWGEAGPDDDVGQLVVDRRSYGPQGGDLTALLASGDFPPAALPWTLDRFRAREVPVVAAGGTVDAIVVLVERRWGPKALRIVEAALSVVPVDPAE